MCLYIGNYDVSVIADEDITVYKILRKTYANGHYLSPYQNFGYELGKENQSKLVRIEYESGKTVIEEGLHTFVRRDEAQCNITLSGRHSEEYVIVECIIPKGSRYYVGKWGFFNFESIASDTLRTVKVCE